MGLCVQLKVSLFLHCSHQVGAKQVANLFHTVLGFCFATFLEYFFSLKCFDLIQVFLTFNPNVFEKILFKTSFLMSLFALEAREQLSLLPFILLFPVSSSLS